MNKHIHKIMINEIHNDVNTYTYKYDFGHTKNIILTIQHNAVCIEVALSKIYDKDELMTKDAYLFPDALRKALLIHIMKFSENITISTMSVSIDERQETVIDIKQGDEKPIYSLVDGTIEPVGDWNDDEMQGILSQKKSLPDPRVAALYAYITSKSKHYKAEKFIYLWMAFNGMYNFFFDMVAKNLIKTRISERLQLECFLRLNDLVTIRGNYNNKAYRKVENRDIDVVVAQKIGAIIKNYDISQISKATLENGSCKELSEKIHNKLLEFPLYQNFDITAYGYLSVFFPYHLRCNIIHANKPLTMFSYRNDEEMIYLQVTNTLLDEFISENLHKWFDKKYIAYLEEKAKEIADEISNKK